jgi:type VI protein secretion system component VasF
MDRRNRKLRRRLRVIAARAMLCVLVFSALGFTGYRQAVSTDDTASQSAALGP